MDIVIKLDDELYNEILSRKYSKTRLPMRQKRYAKQMGFSIEKESIPSGSSSEKPRLIDPAYEKMLNKWIGAEVLDRIRNEMHATAEKHEDGVYYLRDEWVDEIIDKYKGESEGE